MNDLAHNLAPHDAPPQILGACRDRYARDAVWRINERTKALESRVPYTWLGTRLYHNVLGRDVVRVLHRPEQFRSASFLRTLRMLPVADGHPEHNGQSIDIDVSDNGRRFICGSTGDEVTFEELPLLALDDVLGAEEVPTGRVSVTDPRVIRKITNPKDPRTQTSLGYLPGWFGPSDDERAGERDGHPFGVWESEHGPVPYDLEHVVDVLDPRIVALAAREPSFNDETLGANHIAAALRLGRGEQASELLRLVDVRDASGRTVSYFLPQAQVPNQEHTPGAHTMPDPTTVYKVSVGDVAPKAAPVLAKLGLPIVVHTFDVGSEDVAAKFREIGQMFAALADAVLGAQEGQETAEGERDQEQVMREEAVEKRDEALTAAEDAKSLIKKLEAELEPLRADAFAALKETACRILGVASDKAPEAITSALTADALRQATVEAQRGKALPDKQPAYFNGAFDSLVSSTCADAVSEDENLTTRANDSTGAKPKPKSPLGSKVRASDSRRTRKTKRSGPSLREGVAALDGKAHTTPPTAN